MSEIDLNAPEVQTAIEEATKGLVKKRDELLAEVKKLRKDSSIDPDDYNRLKEEKETLSDKLNELTKTSKQYTAELERIKKAAADEAEYSSKLLVETNLNDAINSIGIKPEFNRAVKALFANQAQVIASQEGRSVKIGDKSVSDFMKEWSETDEGKSFRAAPINQGGGSTGGQGGKTGKKTITKSDYRALDPQSKIDFSKSGGEIID
jgi:seryl-tRNA synthetase